MDYTKFQELLKKAMDGRSQAAFSRVSGISQVQLNRMLNQPKVAGRPSLPTLYKIARSTKNAEDAVSLNELLEVCGYPVTENVKQIAMDRHALSIEERISECEKDILMAFKDISSKRYPYDSLDDDIDILNNKYAYENIKCSFCDEERNEYEFINAGAYYRTFILTWETNEKREFLNITPGVVTYYKTDDGKYVGCNYYFDAVTLSLYDLIENKKDDKRDIITITDTYRKELNFVPWDIDELLTSKDAEIRYPALVTGDGFEITDDIPNLKEFLKNHKDSFVKTKDDEIMFNEAMSGDPYEVYKEFIDEEEVSEGIGCVISTIIKNETGRHFACWSEDDFFNLNGDSKSRVYILDDLDYVLFQENDGFEPINDILYRYCKELGIKEFGEVNVRITYTPDYNNMYRMTDKNMIGYELIPREEVRKRYPDNTKKLVSMSNDINDAMRTLVLLADESPVGEPHEVMLRGVIDKLKKSRNWLDKIYVKL